MFYRLSALALTALCTAPAVAGETWFGDFDAAVAAAKKSNKDLFVDFTGSDWCGWCIRLHDEVLGFDEFVEAAEKNFVLVSLDYPRGKEAKAKVPNPERNEELSKKYEIKGFPTILLMDVDGVVYGRTGYQAGGVEKYLAHLEKLRSAGKKALTNSNEAIAAFLAAGDDAKKFAAWENCVATLESLDAGSPFAEKLAGPVRWALEHDADNAKGHKLRAVTALVKSGMSDDKVMEAARSLDTKNERGLLEKVVESQFMAVKDEATARAAVAALTSLNELGFQDKEIGFGLNFIAARWCAGPLEDRDSLEKIVAAARAIGTDDEAQLKALSELLEG